jgi:hypothetical protein
LRLFRPTALSILCTGAVLFPSSRPLALLAQEIPCAQSTDVLAADPFPDANGYANFCTWRNPYVVVFKDHVEIFDRTHDRRYTRNRDELMQALSRLPRSAWPDGKVVAVALEEDADTAPAAELSLIVGAYHAVSKDLAGRGIAVARVPVW